MSHSGGAGAPRTLERAQGDGGPTRTFHLCFHPVSQELDLPQGLIV